MSPVLSSVGTSVRVVERQPTLRTGAPSANQPGPHGTWGWARRWTRSGHPPDMSGHAGGQLAGISVQPRERPGLVPVTPSNEAAPPVIAQPELPGFQQDPEHPLTRELLRQQIDEFVEDAYAGDGSILLADGYDEPLIGFGAQ